MLEGSNAVSVVHSDRTIVWVKQWVFLNRLICNTLFCFSEMTAVCSCFMHSFVLDWDRSVGEAHRDNSWQGQPLKTALSNSEQVLHRMTSPLLHVHKPVPPLSTIVLTSIQGQSWRAVFIEVSVQVTSANQTSLYHYTFASRNSWCPTSVSTVHLTKSLVLYSPNKIWSRLFRHLFSDAWILISLLATRVQTLYSLAIATVVVAILM